MRLKFEILNPNPSTHSTALRAGFAQDKNRNKSEFSNVQNSKRDSSPFGYAQGKLLSFRMTKMWIPVFTGMTPH